MKKQRKLSIRFLKIISIGIIYFILETRTFEFLMFLNIKMLQKKERAFP